MASGADGEKANDIETMTMMNSEARTIAALVAGLAIDANIMVKNLTTTSQKLLEDNPYSSLTVEITPT